MSFIKLVSVSSQFIKREHENFYLFMYIKTLHHWFQIKFLDLLLNIPSNFNMFDMKTGLKKYFS